MRKPLLLVVCLMLGACVSPQPVSTEHMQSIGQSRWDEIQSSKDSLPSGELELGQALIRALARNTEYRIRSLELAIATGNRKLANIEMLPNLTAQAGYRSRSNELASSSNSVLSGEASLEPSVSSDKYSHSYSLELGWNMLDFGMQYFRAREFAEQELIAGQERRRVMNEITRDLVHAWSLAVSLNQLKPQVDEVRLAVNDALRQSDIIVKQRLRDPVDVLEYRKALFLVLKRLDRLVSDMEQAQADLARILKLPPGQHYKLASSPVALPELPQASLDGWQLLALSQRPEMLAAEYQSRIAKINSRKMWMDFLPSIGATYSANYDSNSYLVNNRWDEFGAGVSWNLMRFAAMPGAYRNAKLAEELAEAKASAQALAVVSQVALAFKSLEHTRYANCISQGLVDVDDRRLVLMQARQSAATIDRLTVIRARVDNLLLQAEKSMDAADALRANMTMLLSIGVDVLPENLVSASSSDDASVMLERWWREGLPERVKSGLSVAEKRVSDSNAAVVVEAVADEAVMVSEQDATDALMSERIGSESVSCY